MPSSNRILLPTPSNTKIPTLIASFHAQTIFKGFVKVRKSVQFEITALLFYKNGLMKQKLSSCRKLLNEQNGAQFTSKVCFDMIKAIKGSHLIKSIVTFLKSTKNVLFSTVPGLAIPYLNRLISTCKLILRRIFVWLNGSFLVAIR